MNKKFKISLSGLVVSLPLATAIACASGWSDEDSKIFADLTSQEGLLKLETTWLEKVVSTQYFPNSEIDVKDLDILKSHTDVQRAFSWYVDNSLANDSGFLRDIGAKLLEKEKYQPDYSPSTGISGPDNVTRLSEIGLNFDYNWEKKWLPWFLDNVDGTPATGGGVHSIDEVIKTLFEYPEIGLKTEVFRLMALSKYMEISREKWAAVFPDDDDDLNTIIKSANEEENFPLTKFGLEKRPFMKWDLTLNTKDSLPYIGYGPLDSVEANKHFVRGSVLADGSETIAESGFYKNDHTHVNMTSLPLNNPNIGEYAGLEQFVSYQGVASQSRIGNGKLDFKLDRLKEALDRNHYVGFLQDEDIVTDDIKYIQDQSSDVQITKAIGLMPIWFFDDSDADNVIAHFTYDKTYFYDKNTTTGFDNRDTLTWNFYSFDQGIWDDAEEYFINEAGEDIKLFIGNKRVREALIDMGLKYISDKNPPTTNVLDIYL